MRVARQPAAARAAVAVEDGVGHRRRAPARPGRRAARPSRAASLVAGADRDCSTATANARDRRRRPACPDRTSRSWPPPCSTGTGSTPRPAAARRPRPGRRSCAPVTVSASAPLAAKSTGSCPAACTASVWNGTPCSRATAASSATGWTVPTSLFAHITLTSATLSGSRSIAARSDVRAAARPVASTGSQLDLGALVLGQPLHGVEHRVVLDRRGQHPPPRPRVRRAARPVQALDREVVGLGAAAGEDDLAGPRAERLARSARATPRPPGGPGGPACAATTGCRAGRAPPSSPRAPRAASAWSPHGRGTPGSPGPAVGLTPRLLEVPHDDSSLAAIR